MIHDSLSEFEISLNFGCFQFDVKTYQDYRRLAKPENALFPSQIHVSDNTSVNFYFYLSSVDERYSFIHR